MSYLILDLSFFYHFWLIYHNEHRVSGAAGASVRMDSIQLDNSIQVDNSILCGDACRRDAEHCFTVSFKRLVQIDIYINIYTYITYISNAYIF